MCDSIPFVALWPLLARQEGTQDAPSHPEATIFLKKTIPGCALHPAVPARAGASLHTCAKPRGLLVTYHWHLMALWASKSTLSEPLRECPEKLPKSLQLPAWRCSPFWQRAGSWRGEPVLAALTLAAGIKNLRVAERRKWLGGWKGERN